VREDGRILLEKGGRKKYITERNGRRSWEWQGIVKFCTCQWNEWMNSSLWHFVVGSYSNIQLLLPVITHLKKSGSFWRWSRRFTHSCSVF
jgi:hypothetical protein